jgi:hypothetical protein
VYSSAGKNSLHAKIKLTDKKYAEDYLSYPEYEAIISKYFNVVSSEIYGLFIPKLWVFPRLARKIQPTLEIMFRRILPNLFHEKIYLLKKK